MEAINPVDTDYRMKKIFAIYPSDRSLLSRIYNNKTKKNEMYRQFSKDEIQMGNKHEESVNFTSHHRNANQNHTEILPTQPEGQS